MEMERQIFSDFAIWSKEILMGRFYLFIWHWCGILVFERGGYDEEFALYVGID